MFQTGFFVFDPMKTLHHPQTRAALNLPGLCPVCGGAASRKVTCDGGGARETYRCPVDGETEYSHGTAMGIRVAGRTLDDTGPLSYGGFVPLAAVAGA